MKLKLKEQPKEWQKFTALMVAAAGVASLLLYRRHVISVLGLRVLGLALALVLVVCALRPRWFRGFYRRGMAASFYVGQALGGVWLTIFFLLVLTPVGLLLRLLGKDLLGIKRRSTTSYWHPSATANRFDRQF